MNTRLKLRRVFGTVAIAIVVVLHGPWYGYMTERSQVVFAGSVISGDLSLSLYDGPSNDALVQRLIF